MENDRFLLQGELAAASSFLQVIFGQTGVPQFETNTDCHYSTFLI